MLLHHLVERIAQAYPEYTALVYGDDILTYHELNQRANQLAHFLQPQAADTLIAFRLPRTVDMVVVMLAILKTGAGYLALDPKAPSAREVVMLAEVQPVRVVDEATLTTVNWDVMATQNLACEHEGNSLCYVIYTSGSTGKPKGVMVEHQQVCHLVEQFHRHFSISSETRVAQFSSVNFDASIWEIFPALCVGASLYIIDDATRYLPERCHAFLQMHQVSMATLPPVVLSQMPKEPLPALKTLMVAGESCPQETVDYWCMGREFINAYGPSENTVCATFSVLTPGMPANHLGNSIGNVNCYVLDERQQPVSYGQTGELYLGGHGVVRGYFQRPELTAQRFLCLFGQRVYRTGDKVQLNHDGSLQFLGRLDNQVKIRGYRIELAEVVYWVRSYHSVNQAVVVVKENNNQKYLACYYTVNHSATISDLSLQKFVSEHLPDYMVPSAWCMLVRFPMTVNGKVDEAKLPSCKQGLSLAYVAPVSNVEQMVCHIWQEVLDVSMVGMQDNFLQLGGCSMNAARVANEIQKHLHVACSPVSILQYPTVRSWCREVFPFAEQDYPQVLSTPGCQLSWVQQYFYYHEEQYGNQFCYNEQFTVTTPILHMDVLQRALNWVYARHPLLRLGYKKNHENAAVSYTKENVLCPQIGYVDLREKAEPERSYPALVNHLAQQPFDLTNPPLFRMVFCQLSEHHAKLFCVFHRCLADGTSIYSVLLPELAQCYVTLSEGKLPVCSPVSASYQDFVQHYESEREKKILRHGAFWCELIARYSPTFLPPDFVKTSMDNRQGNMVTTELNTELTTLCRERAQKLKVSLFSLLVSVFFSTLAQFTHTKKLCIGTVLHGRDWHAYHNVVGLFFDGCVLVSDWEPGLTFCEYATLTHQRNLSLFSKKVPFDTLLAYHQENSSRHRFDSDLIRTAFALEPHEPEYALDWQVSQLEAHPGTAPCDFYMECDEKSERILVRLEYASAQYTSETVQAFLTQFKAYLKSYLRFSEAPMESLEFDSEQLYNP